MLNLTNCYRRKKLSLLSSYVWMCAPNDSWTIVQGLKVKNASGVNGLSIFFGGGKFGFKNIQNYFSFFIFEKCLRCSKWMSFHKLYIWLSVLLLPVLLLFCWGRVCVGAGLDCQGACPPTSPGRSIPRCISSSLLVRTDILRSKPEQI